jgi:hypothetical protein
MFDTREPAIAGIIGTTTAAEQATDLKNPTHRLARAVRTRYLRYRCLVGVFAWLVVSPALAWNDAGHRKIALTAHDAMSEDVRARANAIVRAHPRFEPDFVARRSRTVDLTDPQARDRSDFATASTWPDLAREFSHVTGAQQRAALVALYHRGPWHYVNLPTFLAPADAARLGGLATPVLDAPSLRDDAADEARSMNIVQALRYLEGRWRQPISDAERSLALSWILHLVADLHQPLHATALFAEGVFTTGDRGGNLIRTGERDNLHRLWDRSLGESVRTIDIERGVAMLAREAVGAESTIDFAAWAQESRELAASVVYSAQLRGAVEEQRHARGHAFVTVDAHYRDLARRTARARGALAAHRTALVLTTLLR